MNIDAEEYDTPKQDTSSTNIVTILHISARIDIAGYRDADKIWYSLSTLDEAPGPRKVSSPDLLVHIHLERVVVAPKEDTIDPDKDNIAFVPLDSRESEYGDPAHEEGDLAEVLPAHLAVT